MGQHYLYSNGCLSSAHSNPADTLLKAIPHLTRGCALWVQEADHGTHGTGAAKRCISGPQEM